MLNTIYSQRVLDCVVESAIAVSADYYGRPNQYGGVDDGTAQLLQQLRSRTGNDPEWPDYMQRQRMYAALIGDADNEDSNFAAAAEEVRRAAKNYAEGAILYGNVNGKPLMSPGEPALRRAFQDALATFQGVLGVVKDTAVLKSSAAQTARIFQVAVKVLQQEKVARAFSVEPAPAGPWPITSRQDGKGALLLQEVSRTLAGGNLRPVRMLRFLLQQRVASYGGQTIQMALDHDENAKVDSLPKAIEVAYGWATALNEVQQAPA